MSYPKPLVRFRFSYLFALTLLPLLLFWSSVYTTSQTVRITLPVNSKTQFGCYAERRLDSEGLVHHEGFLPQRPRKADSVYYAVHRRGKVMR